MVFILHLESYAFESDRRHAPLLLKAMPKINLISFDKFFFCLLCYEWNTERVNLRLYGKFALPF